MSFPAYDEYKDSGVEWLNQVPDTWEVRTISSLTTKITNGYVGPTRGILVDDGVRYLQSLHIKQNEIRFNTPYYVTEEWSNEHEKSILETGDVLVVQTGDIGQVAVVPDEFAGCNCHALIILAPRRDEVSGVWISWVFNSDFGFHSLMAIKTGALHPHLNCGNVKYLKIPVPPLDEQKAISSFLDVETSKIDGLVSEQRRLIELLKEKRQAVISHAVTKGLNPHAPMKPSGIQWLGDVPQHWEVKPLKYLAKFRSGGTPSKTVPAYWHGDVPWASSKDLKKETLADTIDHITQHALNSDAATLVPAGSVLVVVRGMILLHTFPVVQTLTAMAINQDLKALTPAECIHESYLPWLLRGSTNATFGRIDEAAHGTKVLRMEAWTSIQLPVPPIAEQLEIVASVGRRLDTLRQLQAEAEQAIELLQERRTALISAAVTGKIDVRGMVNKEVLT